MKLYRLGPDIVCAESTEDALQVAAEVEGYASVAEYQGDHQDLVPVEFAGDAEVLVGLEPEEVSVLVARMKGEVALRASAAQWSAAARRGILASSEY